MQEPATHMRYKTRSTKSLLGTGTFVLLSALINIAERIMPQMPSISANNLTYITEVNQNVKVVLPLCILSNPKVIMNAIRFTAIIVHRDLLKYCIPISSYTDINAQNTKYDSGTAHRAKAASKILSVLSVFSGFLKPITVRTTDSIRPRMKIKGEQKTLKKRG